MSPTDAYPAAGRCASGRSGLRMNMAVALIVAAALLSGCGLFSRPETDPAAQSALVRLQNHNAGLTRFKSIGRLTLQEQGKTIQSYRVAAAGKLPGKLRIDLLAPVGGSAASLASDSHSLFVMRHAKREFHQWPVGNGSLDRFANLPLRISDLLALMTGRIPLEKDRFPLLDADHDGRPAGFRLTDRRGRMRQKITLDEAGRPVSAVWWAAGGQESMTVAFNGMHLVEGFALPRRIDLRGADEQLLVITLDRYMANPVVADALFVLHPVDP